MTLAIVDFCAVNGTTGVPGVEIRCVGPKTVTPDPTDSDGWRMNVRLSEACYTIFSSQNGLQFASPLTEIIEDGQTIILQQSGGGQTPRDLANDSDRSHEACTSGTNDSAAARPDDKVASSP